MGIWHFPSRLDVLSFRSDGRRPDGLATPVLTQFLILASLPMPTERRFNEEETAFILERAAAADADASDPGTSLTDSRRAPTGGMTIAQLQEIAAEVGLNSQAVEAAARAVERGDLVPTQQMTYVGLPIGVTRTIHLDRAVTDSEWERLVVALRETFQARGRTGQEGTLRHWSNGNLQALLEPTATGYQLRLRTIKGDARLLLGMGAAALVTTSVMSVPLLMSPTAPIKWLGPALLAIAGVASIARAVITLPRWARTRASQMEKLAATATRILNP